METELQESYSEIADLKDRLRLTNVQYKQILDKVNEAQV